MPAPQHPNDGQTQYTGQRDGEIPGSEPTIIELLYVEDCPSVAHVLLRIERILKQAAIPGDIVLRQIADPDQARHERFLGSPSIRVAGHDIEPGAESRTDYGIKCRLYPSSTGTSGQPPERWLHGALLALPADF